jgi:hypothetical protein
MGEGERERERRPAASTERARSRVLCCFGEVGVAERPGDGVRLEEEEPLRRGFGGAITGGGPVFGEEEPLDVPNHSDRRDALTGTVMRE